VTGVSGASWTPPEAEEAPLREATVLAQRATEPGVGMRGQTADELEAGQKEVRRLVDVVAEAIGGELTPPHAGQRSLTRIARALSLRSGT
jgi:hypothetical protein